MLKKIFISLGVFCLMSFQSFGQERTLLDKMESEADFIRVMKRVSIDFPRDYLDESCDLLNNKNYIAAANMTILGALSGDQDSMNALCQLNYSQFSEIAGFLDENFQSIYENGKPIDFKSQEDSVFKHLFAMREMLKKQYRNS